MSRALSFPLAFPISLLVLPLLVSACGALEEPTTMIPTVEIATRATQEVMPKASIADPTLAPESTFTPSPAPLVTATTSALSETRVFSTTLHVATARTLLTVGEILTVEVSIHDNSVGCQFGAMDLTLSQQNGDVFALERHKVTSPGSGAVFTLTAVSSGTVTLSAYAFGEHNCGHSRSDWYWAGVGGTSGPITIVEPAAGMMPAVTPGAPRTPAVPTATITHGPAHLVKPKQMVHFGVGPLVKPVPIQTRCTLQLYKPRYTTDARSRRTYFGLISHAHAYGYSDADSATSDSFADRLLYRLR